MKKQKNKSRFFLANHKSSKIVENYSKINFYIKYCILGRLEQKILIFEICKMSE